MMHPEHEQSELANTFSLAKEIQNMEVEAKLDQTLGAAQDQLPLMERYTTADAGIPRAEADQALAAMEAELPEFTPQVLAKLGVPEQNWTLNQSQTAAFRKEGHLEVSPDNFRVVTDEAEEDWLLKSPPWMYERWGGPEKKTYKLISLSWMQREVQASRLANLVDYPVPETRLVQLEGKPWLAYQYVAEARDSEEPSVPIANRHDRYCRPLFNALVDAWGDSAHQGIVDQSDGRYYANDIAVGTDSLPAEPPSRLMLTMLQRLRGQSPDRIDYGSAIELSPVEQSTAIEQFMLKLSHLTSEAIETVFADKIGPAEERSRMVEKIKLNVATLKGLYRRGSFGSGIGAPLD